MDLECLLIADDLTGACDAAVQFASRGLRTRVSLDCDDWAEPVDVLAISTESRDAEMASFRQALDRLPTLRPRILFKKIDSTLRGNVGQEVAAAMAAFDCDVSMVTPAFPAMGRTVEGGYLCVTAEIGFVPRELAASFRDLPRAHFARMKLLDAVCDADLDTLVSEALTGDSPQRILWAGSAGLAAALARAIRSNSPTALVFDAAPTIFCLGSDHAATMEQQHRLVQQRAATLFPADTATPQAIRAARERRQHVVLRVQRGCTPAGRIRELLADAAGPLVLCGGDTASVVCRALDIRAIELRREIAPGIPCGLLQGGPFDGFPVVTKSGGFGSPDALIEVADFFSCPQLLH